MHNILEAKASDEHDFEGSTLNHGVVARGVLRLHSQHDFARVIEENPITAGGEAEGDVLVREFRGGAAVFVPDVDGLPVLRKGRKHSPRSYMVSCTERSKDTRMWLFFPA